MMNCMRASGTFRVVAFGPASSGPDSAVATQLPAAVAATMEKLYEGDIAGRSATSFAADPDRLVEVGACAEPGFSAQQTGRWVALETFEGTVGGRDGAFDFAHSTTDAAGGAEKFIRIVPASGTGLLTGIHGTGGMTIDADGTHRIWLDYELG
jgi:hypothetical protein